MARALPSLAPFLLYVSLQDLVNVTISANTASATSPSFAIPLVAAYHTHYTDRVRYYTQPSGMITDGFLATDPAYLAVSKAFAQNPSPVKVGVGRRALPPSQLIHLTVTDSTQGDVVSLSIGTPALGLQAVTYTIPGAASTSSVATAVAALITGYGVSATASGSTISCTPTVANTLFDVQNWTSNLTFADATTDPGIATDLAAILLADNAWYGLGLDSNSPAEILAAAAWVESNKKFFISNTSDSACGTSSTSDVMSQAKAAGYTRTGIFYSGTQLLSYSGFATMSLGLPKTPGSYTFAFKAPASVPADGLGTLNETQYGYIVTSATNAAKNGNVLQPIANLNTTYPGMSASGQYLDLVVFIDWLTAEIQTDVFTVLHGNDKIPFTDAGVDVLRSVVLADLNNAAAPPINGLVAGTTFFSAPPVANVSTTNRAARNLPTCTFGGKLSGAIQSVNFQGTLTV